MRKRSELNLKEEIMNSKDEYIKRMHVKLDELNAEIDSLTAKAGEVATDVKQDIQNQIELLKSKQTAARQKMEELQHAGGSALEDMKSGIDLAWSAIGEAIDSARSRFK
jgi:ElaB/YqjD/DUF883 family membrane-anchored ribosome-binding protein